MKVWNTFHTVGNRSVFVIYFCFLSLPHSFVCSLCLAGPFCPLSRFCPFCQFPGALSEGQFTLCQIKFYSCNIFSFSIDYCESFNAVVSYFVTLIFTHSARSASPVWLSASIAWTNMLWKLQIKPTALNTYWMYMMMSRNDNTSNLMFYPS